MVLELSHVCEQSHYIKVANNRAMVNVCVVAEKGRCIHVSHGFCMGKVFEAL